MDRSRTTNTIETCCFCAVGGGLMGKRMAHDGKRDKEAVERVEIALRTKEGTVRGRLHTCTDRDLKIWLQSKTGKPWGCYLKQRKVDEIAKLLQAAE